MSMQMMIVPHSEPLMIEFGKFARHMDDDEFFEFCQANRDLRIERTSDGEVIIMPPTGAESGRRNFSLNGQFYLWVEVDGTGVGFDSSTGFVLPNGAKRSPDLAWIRQERWEQLTAQEKEGFAPLCPDFVVELRSRTDSLPTLHEKMRKYLANGARLGWLIDALEKKVYVYRPDAMVDCLKDQRSVSGEPVLPGFTLDLTRIW
jgi:Uma2 family endonuclease